ncbi:MAG: tetratricopeptide repeat protein [Simkaniaceae bacterium]|nr:tetratricopeptide repeat protein [Simkaniaceae bacterium]
MFSRLHLISPVIASFVVASGMASPFSLSAPPIVSSKTGADEEAFLVRRIAELRKDGDLTLVKMQILDFLDRYPESTLREYLLGILGDVRLSENSYESALSAYEGISDPHIKEKIILNKLRCYYELEQTAKIVTEGRPFVGVRTEALKEHADELLFLVAEGCLKEAEAEAIPEAKKRLAEEAKGYYSGLTGTPYEEAATFALAEIRTVLGEMKEAADAYLALAALYPDRREQLLFQAATLQSRFDPEEAIRNFRTIQNAGDALAGDAAFNVISLLSTLERYGEIVAVYEQVESLIPENRRTDFRFIAGESLFRVGNHAKASELFGLIIDSSPEQPDNLLLMQALCAHRLKNEPLLQETVGRLQTLFPDHPETAKVLFMHALLLREQGDLPAAREALVALTEGYPDFPDRAGLLLERGTLARDMGEIRTGYVAFKEYARNHPEGADIDTARKLWLMSSVDLYREDADYGAQPFFDDLHALYEYRECLTQAESDAYVVLYAKMAYELQKYDTALDLLIPRLLSGGADEIEKNVLAEARFIAALCHAEMKNDLALFCNLMEEALSLVPDTYDTPGNRIRLYNAYVTRADRKEKPSEGEGLLDRAALHLECATEHTEEGVSIKRENLLWLAEYRFLQAERYMSAHWSHTVADREEIRSAVKRAAKLYGSLLYEGSTPVRLNAETLHPEKEFLRLATLMGYQNNHVERARVLKELIQQQIDSDVTDRDIHKQALFELALAYEEAGDKEAACNTFGFIRTSAHHFPPRLAYAATLHAARLRFDSLDKERRTESDPEVMAILNDLKEIQIRKEAFSEPVHLEAALTYATIRAETGDPEKAEERYLFFLRRIEEDFMEEEIPSTRQYLTSFDDHPEAKAMFMGYMDFIRAEKSRLTPVSDESETVLPPYRALKENPAISKELYMRILERI